MSCCGRRTPASTRDERSAPLRRPLLDPPARRRSHSADRTPSIGFEYVGDTVLTVIGPITRRRYRFVGEGAVHFVDPRDAPGLETVPRLRRLRSSSADSRPR